jgi:hypothetical protein
MWPQSITSQLGDASKTKSCVWQVITTGGYTEASVVSNRAAVVGDTGTADALAG